MIRLLKGTTSVPKKYYDGFEKGDTIWGDGATPQELKRWSIDQKEQAKAALAKCKCEYIKKREDYRIVEYALETNFADCDFAKMDFSSFQQEALRNGVNDDPENVWVVVDGQQVIVDISDVLDHDEEEEAFEASCYLEENLDASGWDALYTAYCK